MALTAQEKSLLEQNYTNAMGAEPSNMAVSNEAQWNKPRFSDISKKYNVQNLTSTPQQEAPRQLQGPLEAAGATIGGVFGAIGGGLQKVGEGAFGVARSFGDLGQAVGAGLTGGDSSRHVEQAFRHMGAEGVFRGIQGVGEIAASPIIGGMQAGIQALPSQTQVQVGETVQNIGNMYKGAMGSLGMKEGSLAYDTITQGGQALMDIIGAKASSVAGKTVTKPEFTQAMGQVAKGMTKVDAQKFKQVAQQAYKQAQAQAKAVQRGVQGATEGVGKFGKMIGKEAVQKVSGAEWKDLQFQYKNPKLAEKIAKGEINEQGVFQSIGTKLADMFSERGVIGAKKEEIRQAGGNVNMPNKNFIKDFFKKELQLVEKDGKLAKAPKGQSKPIKDTELKTINSLIGQYGSSKLNMNRFLNLVDELDDVAAWSQSVDKSKILRGVSRTLRHEVSKLGKGQNEAYAQFTKQYGDIMEKLTPIKKKLLDKDGTFKATFSEDTVQSLLNPSNRKALTALEEVIPNIKKTLEGLKTAKNIGVATGNKVGQYTRAGLAVAGGATLNPLLLGASAVVSPEVVAKIARALGKKKQIKRSKGKRD